MGTKDDIWVANHVILNRPAFQFKTLRSLHVTRRLQQLKERRILNIVIVYSTYPVQYNDCVMYLRVNNIWELYCTFKRWIHVTKTCTWY